jgi:hypothetical protein
MMVMYPRCGLVRAVNSVSKQASVSRSSSPVTRRVPCFDLHQHLRQIAIRRRSADQRHIRSALENLFAFLLGDAAQDAETFALLLVFLVIGEAVEDFLLGLVADGAGVIEHQSGFFDRRPGDSLRRAASQRPFRSRGRSSGSRKFRGKRSCVTEGIPGGRSTRSVLRRRFTCCTRFRRNPKVAFLPRRGT